MRNAAICATPRLCCWSAIVALVFALGKTASAEPAVPGTGRAIPQVGDDFEDPKWKFILNYPKSTYNLDKNQRLPSGQSTNGRWYEGMKRGTPDYVRRVKTPENGLPGSKGALALRSLKTGIPGRPSFQQQQGDYITDVQSRLGGTISVQRTPNVVTRVYLPPVNQWENRTDVTLRFASR